MTHGRSLRFRLLVAAGLSIGLALLAAGAGLTALFERHVERRIQAQLDDTLGLILGHLDATPDGRIRFDLPLADPRFAIPLSGLYWQIEDEDRPTLLRSRSLWDTVLELPGDALADGVLHRHLLPGPADQSLLVLERRVIFRPGPGERHLRVAVALDRQDLAQARAEFAADIRPYLILLGLVLVVAAWVQVRVGLAPLNAVRLGVRAIRAGATRRLPSDYPAEVLPLAEEVNTLLKARERDIERARAWTADLAHGLKTPLVVLAADAERLRALGQPELADDLDGLAQAMRRRVDRELIRARVRAGAHGGVGAGPAAAETDLEVTLNRVVRALERTPEGTRRRWLLECPTPVPVPIPPEDLAELLGNCLENAAHWAATQVRVRVTTADRIQVQIADDGPGVPEAVLKDLGQRGLRLDERTQGSGLGLAIAQDICDAYGSELRFGRADLGGLAVTLVLPRGRAGAPEGPA